MLLIPAIDLKDGKCVRLRQGRMEDETVFGDDPVEVARRWVEAGARRLHMVDLNGAFAGKPVNAGAIKAVAEAFPELPIQVGGGIRDEDTVQAYLDAGVQYTVLDDFHFIAAGLESDQLRGDFVAEEQGRMLRVFPGSEQLRYTIPFKDPQDSIEHLRQLAHRYPESTIVFADDGDELLVPGILTAFVFQGRE